MSPLDQTIRSFQFHLPAKGQIRFPQIVYTRLYPSAHPLCMIPPAETLRRMEMAKRSPHLAKNISRCAIVLIGSALFFSSCDKETQTGDPKQLILNGWQQFRLEDYTASDRAFSSAIAAV